MIEKEMKFYEHPLLTWFLLIIFPPIGIIVLWLMGHYEMMIRIIISILFGLIFIEFLGFYSSLIRALIYTTIIFYLFYRYHKIKEIEKNTNHLFFYALHDHLEIEQIIKNYFIKFDSFTHCFNDCLYFELYIRKQYPIIYKHLTLSHKEETFINIIYQSSDIVLEKEEILKKESDENQALEIKQKIKHHEDINKHYEKELIQLSNIIKDKLSIKGDNFKIYFTFELLKQASIKYYGELFQKNYGIEFKEVDINQLNKAILHYVSLDYLNTNKNSYDLALFTYYLMHKGALKEESDFYTCMNIISKSIDKEIENRKDLLFKKHLFYPHDSLLKEIETLEVVNQMKTKERFMIFIKDLFKSLGYEKIEKPLNTYLDFIISSNGQTFGVNAIYIDKKKEKLSTKIIQDMRLGLSYNDLEDGIIVSNHLFSTDAYNLADKNHIQLWDQDKLHEKVMFVKRYYRHKKREEPIDEIKFDDISTIPFEQITINDIDNMTGFEFQHYIAQLLKGKGYIINSIHHSRDYGVDIILEKNSLKIGVQTKRSNQQINRDVIGEIITGLPHYQLHKGIIITNQYYNEETICLANRFNITLWDREQLIYEIKQINHKKNQQC